MTDALAQPLPLPVPSEEILRRLALRRSGPAQDLIAPGPDAEQLRTILALGARTPDHGKLFPWRFVVLGPAARAAIADRLLPLANREPKPDKARAVLAKLVRPPVTVMLVSAPIVGHKVPVWEQELSAGAVGANLGHAANALGFVTSWITDWYSYLPQTPEIFGLRPGERIAGFIHIGALAQPPLERPRPDVQALTTYVD